MIRRSEPLHRRYTELCNRSGSPVLRPAHSQMYNANALEDYWEDASVSLRSCHSWEAPSSAWLDASTPASSPDGQNAESKSFHVMGSRHVRPCRYSFDASEYLGSVKGRRFPPPLTSCSTMSIKEGGRFVLKEVDADRPQGFFRAQRENGRLLLHLVLPDEVSEDAVAVEDSDNDEEEDLYETDDGGEDEDVSSVVECTVDSRNGLCDRVVLADVEDFGRRDDCVWSSNGEAAIDRGAFAGHATSLCDGLQDVGSEAGQANLCSTREHVSKDIGCLDMLQRGCHGIVDVGQLVVESRHGKEQGDMLGHCHQESLWNIDAVNHALASRSSWPPNKMCLHQPLINMQPVLGLAMS